VTIQYKMIHPYHTDKHFEKMKRVGKVADFVMRYRYDNSELRSYAFDCAGESLCSSKQHDTNTTSFEFTDTSSIPN
jgi:hypothetical protein